MKKGNHAPKTVRKIVCGVFALLLAASVPVNALAASYTVGNSDELQASWNHANSNSDTNNSFYITNDIEVESSLEAETGKTYIISSKGNGDYELSNVFIESPTSGGGTVIINTDVTGEDDYALTVVGDATVAVNGDVTTTSNTVINGNYVAIEAANGADLTINGDVTAAEAGVYAHDGTITIRGDVTLKSEGNDTHNNHVIDADMGSTVVVTGDVITEESGVTAMRDSTIMIHGDLELKSTDKVDMLNSVIHASDNSSVEVKGNVASEEGGILTNDASVTVRKDVTTEGQTSIFNTSVLHIDGNFRSEPGSKTIQPESGVFVNNSKLYVGKDTETPLLYAENDAVVELGIVEASNVVVAASGGYGDQTKVTTSNMDADLSAFGSSETTVIGSISGHVTAMENAHVEVYGKVGSYDVHDTAVLNINQSNYYDKAETITANKSEDELLNLSLAYSQTSEMGKYLSSVFTAISHVSHDITEDLGFGDALIVSLFQRWDVNLDTLDLPRSYVDKNDTTIHPDSLKAIKDAGFISGYHVKLYKENLHKIFVEMDKQIPADLVDMGDVETIAKITKAFHGTLDSAREILTPEQFEVLSKYVASDGLDNTEAMKFLLEFDYFKTVNSSTKASAQRLVDMFDLCDDLKQTSKTLSDTGYILDQAGNVMKTGGKIMNVVDVFMEGKEFFDFWVRNYESQISVLNTMLIEQPMSAEMAIATATLREEYKQEWFGFLTRGFSLGKEKIVDILKGKSPVMGVIDGAIDVVGLVSGGTKYSEDVMNAAALTSVLPELYFNFESAVKSIRNGNTSEQNLILAKNSHTLLVEALKIMCDAATEVCDDKYEVKKYEDLLKQLQSNDLYTVLNVPPHND